MKTLDFLPLLMGKVSDQNLIIRFALGRKSSKTAGTQEVQVTGTDPLALFLAL